MTENSASNVKGFLLYNPFDHQYFFRIYNEDKTFTDYDLRTEEIEIQIVGDDLSLYTDCPIPHLGWASKVLKPQPGQKVTRISVTGHYDENLKFIPDEI